MAQYQATRKLLEHEAGKASRSIIALATVLIEDALAHGASDLHLQPAADTLSVRLRRDGLLDRPYPLPRDCYAELLARLKILAGLRTDEHFSPQDGRFTFHSRAHGHVDVRIAILPTRYGENAVLRLLTPQRLPDSLHAIGMAPQDEALFSDALSRTHGLILVTGPTGSGKSTTLSVLLRMLLSRPLSVVTIEDPIEYTLPGATQVEVNPRTGLSFVHGLRSLLRQDPDVIMVGEVRDRETAELATHAALTGHLVLATLHANSTAAAQPRLQSLGIEQPAITDTLSLVSAQRLVRKRCVPCAACAHTGFRGRIGVFEVLPRTAATARRTLVEDGLEKVRGGITTMEEITRTCHA